MINEEIFDLVNEENHIIGQASRNQCHGNPHLLHRAVHVVVFHSDGSILLQKRTMNKDIQPGKWDTAVGGHLNQGEDFEEAARREMQEEIGLPAESPLFYLFDSRIRNCIESENIRVFGTFYDGPFQLQKTEVDEVRFWTREELCEKLKDPSDFTPNLIQELNQLMNSNLIIPTNLV